MTLRLRLLAIIGLSFTLLWSAASVWMLLDLRTEFRDALDERLAASARMVAGLVAQLPPTPGATSSSPHSILDVVARDGVACEIRLLQGGLIARTHDSPKGLGLVSSGFSTRTISGQQWRSYTLEQGGKRVTTADRIDKREALLRNVVLATAIPFLIAMVGSLAVLWFGIRKGLAPLESIRTALAERKPDALQPLPATRVPGELAPLVQTINLLLDRTRSAIERERNFTGDAAHELRTPLTAVKTHIQVARLSGGDDAVKALDHAEQGVQRLQRTIEQLLTLARVEGPFSFGEDEQVSPQAVARLAVNEIPPDVRQRVVIEEGAVARALAMPPVLAVTALRNILDNALRYSPKDTRVILRLAEANGFACFTVIDEGPGMTEQERLHAARRFWRQGSGQGSGLGLSIVEAVVARYGGDFQLTGRAEGGMSAQISLPVA